MEQNMSEEWNEPDNLEADVLRKAILAFQNNFETYIKEMDGELWRRGLDYALTFTKIDGVKFELNGEQNDNEEEQGA
jgi:hypothetical protein